jgi:hypothetical protein
LNPGPRIVETLVDAVWRQDAVSDKREPVR